MSKPSHLSVYRGTSVSYDGSRATLARRPVSTYSIVARDAPTGQFGVAVQSHWFSTGSVVPWAQAGIGAVATQSIADPSYGLKGLDLMRTGKTAPEVLDQLLAGDDGRDVRQVAMVDVHGNVAAHTGVRCIGAAGHATDAELGVSCQANLMQQPTVWNAMRTAYRSSLADGNDLANRLLAALDAAQAEGGDVRGKQSAALLIVTGEPTGLPWRDRLFDLRVEDHHDPLVELRRLTALQRAYHHMNRGDAAIESSDVARALTEYAAAIELAPQVVEIRFWAAVALASEGRLNEAMPILREVVDEQPFWLDLLPRLVDSEFVSSEVASRIIDELGR